MSIASDLGKSITGNVETAMLVIHDYRSKKNMKSPASSGGASDADKLAVLQRARSEAVEQALLTGVPPSFPGSQDKTLKVHFNPSQLTINASAIPKSQQDAASGMSRTMAAEDAKLTLTVVLYFDDMDTYDAFMWEKFTSGITAKGIANGVKLTKDLAKKQKPRSVQWQVEALIAALRDPYTRTISFRWANFSFIGQLNTVRANYTMFSTSGRPIRAEVLLRIQHEMDPAMLHNWYASFEEAFGSDGSNLVKPEQNYSALLNLSL